MVPHPGILWFINTDLGATYGYRAKVSPPNHKLIIKPAGERLLERCCAESQSYIINPTNPCGAFDNGIEHRLHVGGRAADDAEHRRCCRLMLQGFAQFHVALLQFFEQPHILDGNHRLVGKGLKQFYLPVGEWANLFSTDVNRTYGNTLAKQGRYQRSPNSHGDSVGLSVGKIGFSCCEVMYMDRFPVENSSTHWTHTPKRIGSLSEDRH